MSKTDAQENKCYGLQSEGDGRKCFTKRQMLPLPHCRSSAFFRVCRGRYKIREALERPVRCCRIACSQHLFVPPFAQPLASLASSTANLQNSYDSHSSMEQSFRASQAPMKFVCHMVQVAPLTRRKRVQSARHYASLNRSPFKLQFRVLFVIAPQQIHRHRVLETLGTTRRSRQIDSRHRCRCRQRCRGACKW